MEVQFTEDLPPEFVQWYDFEVKAVPGVDGRPLESDPTLVVLKVEDRFASRRVGKGKLTLRGSLSDSFHEIPIISIGDFTYSTGPSNWSLFETRRLCGSASYLPIFVRRHYDHLADFATGQNMLEIVLRDACQPPNVEARTFTSSTR